MVAYPYPSEGAWSAPTSDLQAPALRCHSILTDRRPRATTVPVVALLTLPKRRRASTCSPTAYRRSPRAISDVPDVPDDNGVAPRCPRSSRCTARAERFRASASAGPKATISGGNAPERATPAQAATTWPIASVPVNEPSDHDAGHGDQPGGPASREAVVHRHRRAKGQRPRAARGGGRASEPGSAHCPGQCRRAPGRPWSW